ncbi:hypothetical protein RvY_01297 [Ramazzottius varieornatus]|uniref:Uncharacterized protein n=1 Tax=Ramazzottius varieornatus TaxID=947166 RepID=A0A1D1ULV9_RAMVA|nr:hypothetical protein RvY_01297 [Ramazzottius varieornatus]
MTNPTKNGQKRKSQTGPSSTKTKKQAIKERRTQPGTTVDLTGPAENSPPSPSPTTASDTSVGDPTVGAPTVKKKSRAGRPEDSPIWTFFRHDELEDKSVCLVEGCSTELKGMNTGIIP